MQPPQKLYLKGPRKGNCCQHFSVWRWDFFHLPLGLLWTELESFGSQGNVIASAYQYTVCFCWFLGFFFFEFYISVLICLHTWRFVVCFFTPMLLFSFIIRLSCDTRFEQEDLPRNQKSHDAFGRFRLYPLIGKPGLEFFLEQWAVLTWYEPGLCWRVRGEEEVGKIITSIVFFLHLQLCGVFLTTAEN